MQENQDLDPEKLRELFEYLDQHPLTFNLGEGSYAEEDENGVVHLKDKGGHTHIMMARSDYDAIRQQGEEDDQDSGDQNR